MLEEFGVYSGCYLLTDIGNTMVNCLEGQDITVWNGMHWSQAKVNAIGEYTGAKLITTRNQYCDEHLSSIICTPNQEFYGEFGDKIRADKLSAGDNLLRWISPYTKSTLHYFNQVVSVDTIADPVRMFMVTESIREKCIINNVVLR